MHQDPPDTHPDTPAEGPDPVAAAAGPHMPDSLNDLLDEVAELARRSDTPSLEDVLHGFGPAGALPVMMTVAMIVVSPLSGIPLLSSLAGLTIAGLAFQLALGRRSVWLPLWLRCRRVRRSRLEKAVDRLRPTARFLDRNSRPRLQVVTAPPASRLVLGLCGVAGLSMPALELVPFTSSLLALGVTCLGFALLVRDGLWVVVAAIPMLGAGAVLTSVIV